MKRMTVLVMAMTMALLLFAQAALAEGGNAVYTNAPGVGTQDTVEKVEASKAQAPYDIQVLELNAFSADVLTEINRFVRVNQQPVVRYFPEYLQQEVESLAAPVSKDALHMPEFMRILPAEGEKAQVDAAFTFNIDYRVGQLVIVVMGVKEGDEVLWRALPAAVERERVVSFMIPAEWQEKIGGQETLFALLTVRDGEGGNEWDEDDPQENQVGLPSKTVRDTTQIGVSEEIREAAEGTNFRIKLVEPTPKIMAELARIDGHLKAGHPLFTYYNEEIQARIALLLGEDVDTAGIKGYVVESVMQENYRETYDDGYTAFSFAVPYEDGQPVVVAVGVPEKGAMRWVPNRAKVWGGKVHVIFSETVLPQMGHEAALMIVLSTELANAQ